MFNKLDRPSFLKIKTKISQNKMWTGFWKYFRSWLMFPIYIKNIFLDFRLEIEILLVKSTLLISNMFIVFELRAKQNFFISKVRILNFGLLVKIDVFLEKIFWVWLPSIIFRAAFRSIQDTFMLQKWTKKFNTFLNNGQFLVFKMLSWKWLCWANRWDSKKS